MKFIYFIQMSIYPNQITRFIYYSRFTNFHQFPGLFRRNFFLPFKTTDPFRIRNSFDGQISSFSIQSHSHSPFRQGG